VKLGTHLLTNEKVAIKILDKKMIEEQGDTERVSREIQILKKVRHPNIIQLYEVKKNTIIKSIIPHLFTKI
jgi:5'-AMP-activated protein kinase, catalytic alpha subunit